jgi:hypothetical protein
MGAETTEVRASIVQNAMILDRGADSIGQQRWVKMPSPDAENEHVANDLSEADAEDSHSRWREDDGSSCTGL